MEHRALDEDELRDFMATGYRRLVGAFSMIAGSRAVAEDAVEEALVRAWERTRRGERVDDLTVWVAVVAKNLLRSRFRRLAVERRARARLTASTPAPNPIHAFDSVNEHADLLRAVRGLPGSQRDAVALHYFADLSVADVARITRSTDGAVKVRLHRARRALAAALGEPSPEEVDEVAER